ncbi:MAG: hypothetical protein WCW17_00035 [Patescibacteria group bacterium]|jgi:hypothetical protein
MKNNCFKLHKWANSLLVFKFPFDEKIIPLNGLYILFEKGEMAHGANRIVRIGTHTGANQLRSRLKQHFLVENKDRSIFRKNIGRAILNKNNDPYLKLWELDLTSKDAKEKFSTLLNIDYQKQIEKQVSDYIQENFSFVVFQVENKEERLKIESGLISAVSLCPDCSSSDYWLGKFSPKEKIRQSGLWLVNELYKQPLDEKIFNRFIR